MVPSSSPHRVLPFFSLWASGCNLRLNTYLRRGHELSICAWYSTCISHSASGGLKHWSILIFSTSFFYKRSREKQKEKCTLQHEAPSQGLTKQPVVTQQERLQTFSRLAGPGQSHTKTYRSLLAYLVSKGVMVCILTHSPRHCCRQSGQQHLGPRMQRASVSFQCRWRKLHGMQNDAVTDEDGLVV